MTNERPTGTQHTAAAHGMLTKEERQALWTRYTEAAHGVQTGVAMEIAGGSEASTPKHLRTGLDLRAAEHEGLVRLLIAKGVLTEDEYTQAMAEAAERERDRYADRLTTRLGRPVTLA